MQTNSPTLAKQGNVLDIQGFGLLHLEGWSFGIVFQVLSNSIRAIPQTYHVYKIPKNAKGTGVGTGTGTSTGVGRAKGTAQCNAVKRAQAQAQV